MIFFFAALFLALFCESSSAQYRVRRGDTLSGISRRVRSTPRTLQRINRIRNPNLIYPGQRIIYPRPSRNVLRRPMRRPSSISNRRPSSFTSSFSSRPSTSAPSSSSSSSSSNNNVNGLPPSFVNLIRSREGVRYNVYRDSRGFPTSGIGHLMRPQDLSQYPLGSRVPASQVNQWFSQDATPSFRAAQNQAQSLGWQNDPNSVNVLGSMSYQLGNNWPRKFGGLWNDLRQDRYESAIRDARSTAWDRQTPARVNDLVNVLQNDIRENPSTDR